MIRVSVNLARRPPENLRRVRVVWGGALALLAAVFVVLTAIALFAWWGSRPIQQQVDDVHTQMLPLEQTRAQSEAPLHNPRVRAELDRATYLNALIDRKAISWTQLFEQLEKIQPPGVELVSLRPLERNGVHAVDIRFAADTLPPAIDFVEALEKSGDFSGARVEREAESAPVTNRAPGAVPPPRFQIEITALYQPQTSGSGSRGSAARGPAPSNESRP